MDKLYLNFILILILILISLTGCREEGNYNEIEPLRSVTGEKIEQPDYFSKENPGKWDLMAQTHTPVVEFITKNKIRVTVSLKPVRSPRHYIEVIALMKDKNTLIDVKKFNFSFSEASAVFTLPEPDRTGYWIVSKCNKHGRWKTWVMSEK